MAFTNTLFTIAILSVFLCVLVSAQGTISGGPVPIGNSTTFSVPKATSQPTGSTVRATTTSGGATGTTAKASSTSTGAAAAVFQDTTGIVTTLVGAIVAAIVAAF
ncbi:MAG: hypothetical protein M1813_001887 [Trichoglossum hirsutum]|nr:MAG: hypothetical protein M1813_001887 [Trichoglossum hirsutum]